jgi:type IV secretory pathway TraG/TraD family ATPase VirD4
MERALACLSGVKGREVRGEGVYPFGLDDALLHMSGTTWTLGDSFEHAIVLGGTGSGKTSAVMRTLLGRYLRYGYGGLVCTVKSDDTQRILRLAAEADRLDDVMVINPSQPWVLSFLDHELTRAGQGAGNVENAVSVLMEVVEARADGGRRQQSDAYWTEGARRLLRHSIEAIRLAGLRVTMRDIGAVIHGMPVAGEGGQPVSPTDSFLVECMARAEASGHDVRHLHNYFWRELARPGANRQVSGIVSTLTNMMDPLLSGHVATLLASERESNWTPELTRTGKIIILDLPISEWGEVGRNAQLLVKKVWIDAMLRRQGLPRGEVPCFLLCDEYQVLATPSDAKLMQAGRSSCVSALCLTQNLNNLYACFDGVRAQYQAHAMLGNFSTLIGCRNHDKTTNEWFADTIAKTLVRRRNHSVSWGESSSSGGNMGYNHGRSSSAQGGSWSSGSNAGYAWNSGESFNTSSGMSEQFEYPVAPSVFTGLASGGKSHHYQVQAVVFKAGKRFWPHRMPFTGQIFHQR